MNSSQSQDKIEFFIPFFKICKPNEFTLHIRNVNLTLYKSLKILKRDKNFIDLKKFEIYHQKEDDPLNYNFNFLTSVSYPFSLILKNKNDSFFYIFTHNDQLTLLLLKQHIQQSIQNQTNI